MQLTIERALQLATAKHNEGSLNEAENIYRAILKSQPNHPDANYNLGLIAVSLNQIETAVPLFKIALDANPDVEQFWLSYVDSLIRADRPKDARQAIKKAKKRGLNSKKLVKLISQSKRGSESDAEVHFNVGNTLQRAGRLTDAEASYNQAIALKPDFAEAYNNLGLTLQGLGRLTDAEASYNQAIAIKPDFAEAYRQVTEFKKFDSQDDRFSKMLEVYRDDRLSDEQRYHINFGLAKIYEDLEDFERAFTHYNEGNQLRKKLLGYDVSEDEELFRQIKATYPRLKQASFEPEKLSIEPTPIFIVGMPRSGTTLVEQIVSSHPLITGAGELDYVKLLGSAIATGSSSCSHEGLLSFRTGYLDKLKEHAKTNQWVTDKMPHNFRYLGLLAKVFPEAKFIHVKRRPEAVCWGNFKTCFSATHRYAWALDDIVAYYKLYQSLMEFWENELGLEVYSLDYELLTDNQEPETRKLIDFIGLDWEKSCLHPEGNMKSVTTASSLQIRQKVYRGSSKKWKKYEPFLNGAFASLSV